MTVRLLGLFLGLNWLRLKTSVLVDGGKARAVTEVAAMATIERKVFMNIFAERVFLLLNDGRLSV